MAPFFSFLIATLTLIPSLTFASEPLTPQKRAEAIPFLDYAGIEAAAQDALTNALVARGLGGLAERAFRRTGSHGPQCSSVEKRKEWRDLTKQQKKDYIKATKCLLNKPDFGISDISDSLFDAFTAVHQTNWIEFHGVAAFMPWHRWFVWLRSVALKYVCQYNGPTPYWDYPKDYQNPFASPIFSTDDAGFGSHGNVVMNEIAGTSGFKVDNGGFANIRVALPEPHFLARNFSGWKSYDPTGQWGPYLNKAYSPTKVSQTLAAGPDFWSFAKILDGLDNPLALGVHNGPHFFQSGDWTGPNWLIGTQYFPFAATSPNDPLFFPHHGYVDKVFWTWQQKPGNQYKYNGSRSIFDPTLLDAKITDTLPFYGLGPDIPVALAMKTENWPMCYTY